MEGQSTAIHRYPRIFARVVSLEAVSVIAVNLSLMTSWTPFQPILNAESLVQALNSFPSHWSLTPLWEKRPYREGWQSEAFIPHQDLAQIILHGEERLSKRTGKPYQAFCSGYGLRLGDASGGLLAVDVDGNSAENLLRALGETSLPQTVTWTSGKPGRRQLLYQIPDHYRERLASFRRKTITEWEGLTTDAGELLEFRYNQHQSVLPPSFHLETGQYRWLTSPEETEIANAPSWLCDFLVTHTQPKANPQQTTFSRIREISSGVTGNSPLSCLLQEATNHLSIEQIYHWSGHHFQAFGETWRGYCPRHHSQSGTAFSLNPNTGEWYCFGCEVGGGPVQYRHFLQGGNGTPRGKVFRSLVEELAKQAGLSDNISASSPPYQTYQPTHIINQRYFDWETPPEGTILAVKSSLGSGKTTWLGKVVSELREEGWIALGHRNSLLLQSCQRWGFIHLQTEAAFDLINIPTSQLALCVDSLHHFSPEAFVGKNIIIDEAIAVVTHLLTGETLKQKREEILQRFSQALQQAKRIFCLDGMLSDWCVDYLQQLALKNRPLIKVENRYQGEPFTIKFLRESWDETGKNKRSDRSPLLQQLWQSSKPVICTDSQLEAETLDQLLTQSGKEGLRIDSKTIGNPQIKTFLKNPNHYITTHTPDYLIYTPAAEAGIDISIRDYFSDQFCLFFGVLQTNGQQQMISRVRDPKIQRWLWCSRYGQVKHHSPQFQFPPALLEAMQSLILQTGTRLMEGKDPTGIVQQFIQQVTTVTTETHYQTFCIVKAIQNYQKSHLWNCLYQSLVTAGHEVKLISLETCTEAKQQEKTAKELVKLSNAEAICGGTRQQGKQAITLNQLLRKQLPGIEKTSCWNPQFIKRVLYDDRAFIAKQERFWFIHHPHLLQQLIPSPWSSGLEQSLIQEMHQQWSMIQALISLNLPPLLDFNQTWTDHSLELQQLQQKIQTYQLHSALKMQRDQSSPLASFRHVLNLIGVKLSGKKGQYQISASAWYERDRLTVLDCLEKRYFPQPLGVK